MLGVIGASSAEALFAAVPPARCSRPRSTCRRIPRNFLVERHMQALADKNHAAADGPSSSVPAPIAIMCRRPSIT